MICFIPFLGSKSFPFFSASSSVKEEQALRMNEDCSSGFQFRHFKIASNTSQRRHFSFLIQIDVLCLLKKDDL